MDVLKCLDFYTISGTGAMGLWGFLVAGILALWTLDFGTLGLLGLPGIFVTI